MPIVIPMVKYTQGDSGVILDKLYLAIVFGKTALTVALAAV